MISLCLRLADIKAVAGAPALAVVAVLIELWLECANAALVSLSNVPQLAVGTGALQHASAAVLLRSRMVLLPRPAAVKPVKHDTTHRLPSADGS
jgi:hypothetical protein